MDSEYSTDTFMDNSDQLFPKLSSIQIDQLKEENEHLKNFNNKLQSTLENVRKQLQESLQYKDSISQMGNNIQALNDKIRQTSKENLKLAKKVQQMANEREKTEKNTTEIIEQLSNERNNALLSSQRITERLSKIKKSRDDLINACADKSTAIEALQQQILNIQRKKKRQSEEFRDLAEKYDELNVKVAQLEAENQKKSLENKNLSQEVEDLKLQIGTQRALSEGNENAIASLNEEMKAKVAGIQQFECTLKQQKNEIGELISQREKLVALLQNAHTVLCRNEEILGSVCQERDSLKQRTINMDKQFRMQNKVCRKDFVPQNISIPFDGELGEECKKIMLYEHYQAQQRIQMVLNEAAKEVSKLQDKNNKLEENISNINANIEKKDKEADLYKETLLSFINALKAVVLNETEMSKVAGIKEDRAFISCVAGKCAELDPIIKNSDVNNYKYIPSYFFFSDDVNERINTVQRLIQPNDETFSLFTTQFLINSQLKKQLSKAVENIPEHTETAEILESIGLQGVDEIPDFVDGIQEQLTKMKNQRSSIRKALKEAQQAIIQQNKSCQDIQSKNEELKLANDTLTNECNVLKVKNQVLSNDLILKTNEVNSMQERLESHETSIDSSTVDVLRSEIEEKESEIKTLKLQIKQLKSAVEGASLIQARALKKQESSLHEVIATLQDQLTLMAEDSEKKKSKNKKLIRSMQKRHEESLSELASQYEESKQQFNKSLTEMVDKTNKSQEMSQKLVASLQESEKKVQSLVSENNKLQTSMKLLEIQLSSAQEKLAKEKQNVQSQIAAQSLMNESKIQKRVLQMKSEINEQKKSILNIVGKTIGSVYGIDSKSLDEQSLEQLVQQAQKDLEKLRMFQSTYPTYTHV